MSSFASIFDIQNDSDFQREALRVFRHQAEHNTLYKQFLSLLKKDPRTIHRLLDIPFLPISFFKSATLTCSPKKPDIIFSSSGTSGNTTSRHLVSDLSVYVASFTCGFSHFYGSFTDYVILALLPAYLERQGSSLVYMVSHFIEQSPHTESGFYLYDYAKLHNTLLQLKTTGKKVLLIGVSFALLDFVEQFNLDFPDLIIMETGGMKGRRAEMTRQDLHSKLTTGFGVSKIHSEYGMTELLSQAYSKGNGRFQCPPWMQIFIRDISDVQSFVSQGQIGGVNVIDLANHHSISFIATDDLGNMQPHESYEILGRLDHADIRGCNMLFS